MHRSKPHHYSITSSARASTWKADRVRQQVHSLRPGDVLRGRTHRGRKARGKYLPIATHSNYLGIGEASPARRPANCYCVLVRAKVSGAKQETGGHSDVVTS